jgi:hypothetical protein
MKKIIEGSVIADRYFLSIESEKRHKNAIFPFLSHSIKLASVNVKKIASLSHYIFGPTELLKAHWGLFPG